MATARIQQELGLLCITGGPVAWGSTQGNGAAQSIRGLVTGGNIRSRLCLLRAGGGNAGNIIIGGIGMTDDTGNFPGIPLAAGEWFPFALPVADLANWYFIGTSPDIIRWMELGEGTVTPGKTPAV